MDSGYKVPTDKDTFHLPIKNGVVNCDVDVDQQLVSSKKEQDQVPDPPTSSADYSRFFRTNQTFSTHVEALEWVQRVGREQNMVIVERDTLLRPREGRRLVSTVFHCERYGKDRPSRRKDAVERLSMTSTKKCECPFAIGCHVDKGAWRLGVGRGVHNHEIGIYKDDTMNETGSSQTNNVGQKARMGEFEGDAIVQCFRNRAAKFKYFERHRKSEYPDGLSELFFAHPECVNLLRAFPDVLIMNATYKVNRYKMPYFEVMGLTSTMKSFTVACAFMCSNTEDSYLWVLNQLQEMLQLVGLCPITIMTVTKMDLALLNALDTVFPLTKHILCRFHIYMDVKDRCVRGSIGSMFIGWDNIDPFILKCRSVFEAKTEDEYHTQLALLESEWRNQPELIEYVKQSWLNLYKERIVSAWTDNVTHFGFHTMDIDGSAESVGSHLVSLGPQLGFFLNKYEGGCKSFFTFLHSELESQINRIRESLEYSRGFAPCVISGIKWFNMLGGCLSHKACEILVVEYQFVTYGVNVDSCDCVLQSTHGLPCRHIIAKYVEERRLINPSMIHKFWRTLEVGEEVDGADREQYEERILEIFMGQFPHFPDGVRARITEFMYETLLPHCVSTEELPLKKPKLGNSSTKYE